jgi:prepilin-type N-terminal cleavage/methylation domain-containing protein
MKVRGFTLIELLVVIAIIGLLSSIVLASLNMARGKGNDAKRLSDLQELQRSLELYYDDHNAYPSTGGGWYGNCSGFGSHGTSGSSGWIPSLAPTYIPALPLDPKQTSSACYLYRSNDGADYMLLAYKTVESYTGATNKWKRPTAPTENDFAFYTAGAASY